jgi:broad specificity phosphatase PhoE
VSRVRPIQLDRSADVVTIVLVRHASTAWSGVRYCGRSDPPLSDIGVDEALRLGESLVHDLPSGTRVVSSPSRRATATAAAIVETAGLTNVEIDDRWREADLGIAEGRTFDDLSAIAPDLATALAAGELAIDWPAGETHTALADRVAAAWADLVADGRPTVVVTHAGPFMHARAIAGRRPISPDDLVAPAVAHRMEVAAGPSRPPVLPSTT